MLPNQPLFRKRSESLDFFGIYLPLFEFASIIDIEMLIATEHEKIHSTPLKGIHVGPLLTLFTVFVMRL